MVLGCFQAHVVWGLSVAAAGEVPASMAQLVPEQDQDDDDDEDDEDDEEVDDTNVPQAKDGGADDEKDKDDDDDKASQDDKNDDDDEEQDDDKEDVEEDKPEEDESKGDDDDDDDDENGEKVKLESKQKAPGPKKTTNEKGEPIEPGCYVFMPDGCPGKSWGPTPWKRDMWGEANVGASTDRDVCENKRKIKFNNWCGKNNAKMLFIEGAPAHPKQPGCFYWQPTGCPKHDKKGTREWVRDESDEGIDQAACAGKRKKALDKWCGVTDTRTIFVHTQPETPAHPGCYVWMPNGCASHHKFGAQKSWKRDSWGEDRINAAKDKAVCEKRKFSFNTWCEISDTQMLFVAVK